MGGIGRVGSGGGYRRVDTKIDEKKRLERKGKDVDTSKAEGLGKKASVSDLISARGLMGQNADSVRKIRLMRRAADVVKNTMDINEQKVEKIKKMLESGEYKIDLDKLADKLIEDGVIDRLMSF